MLGAIRELTNRLRYFLRKRQADADLREEMAAHFAMLTEARGRVVASSRFGNRTRWEEISREAWGWNWLESLIRDVAFGGRLLVRSPGFTVTSCLSLAFGIGATLGIFALLNALLFKALPVPHPEQLWELAHNQPESDDNFSFRMFDAFEKANRTGIPLFAIGGDYLQVNYGTETRNTPALIASGNTFRSLGLKARIGRFLDPEDDTKGLPRGANCVLSYRLWQTRFHGDATVLGKHLFIGKQAFNIVGVAPESFFGFYVGAYSDLILPLHAYAATNSAQPILEDGGWTWLNIMARVPTDITRRELAANLNTAYPAIRKEIEPSEAAKRDQLSVSSVSTGVSAIRSRFTKPLYLLLTMTGLILVIACANLTNLLLARSVVRAREIAVRLSLGAHRSRILRQLLTESMLIGVIGCCAAVPVFLACTRGLVAFLQSGPDSNVFLDTSPDWRFAVGVVALLFFVVLLFGFGPALRAIRSDVNSALSEGSQRLAAKTSFAKLIVATQISLSLVLLLSATLLARSLFDLRTFNPGFRRDHLLVADVDTTQSIHKNADVARFFERLIAQVRAIPGVRSAAASKVVPLGGISWQGSFELLGRSKSASRLFQSYENWVTPEFFETLGTPWVLGRNFNRQDSNKSARVAVINETFAKGAFGGLNPIGQEFREKDKTDAITIVGIVGDARYRSLRADPPPTLYRPISQLPPSFPFLLTLNLEVWTNAPAADLKQPIERFIRQLDPQASADFISFDSLIDQNLLYERLLTALSVSFGLIGLFLSAVGIYGLCAYTVARRTPEFGIRMALGANPRGILRLVLSEQLRILAFALAAGVILSSALARFLSSFLFGVSATDPTLYLLAAAIIAALALLAALAPAQRAAKLNPTTALRCE